MDRSTKGDPVGGRYGEEPAAGQEAGVEIQQGRPRHQGQPLGQQDQVNKKFMISIVIYYLFSVY